MAVPASAESAIVYRHIGFYAPDADGTLWLLCEAEFRIVQNDNGRNLTGHGQLPDGATLPDKPIKITIPSTDHGPDFEYCVVVDDTGTMTVTPGGNLSCKGEGQPLL
jgi:hypothetical protein